MEEVIAGVGGGKCMLHAARDDPAEVAARASGCAAAIQLLFQCRNVMQPEPSCRGVSGTIRSLSVVRSIGVPRRPLLFRPFVGDQFQEPVGDAARAACVAVDEAQLRHARVEQLALLVVDFVEKLMRAVGSSRSMMRTVSSSS